MSNPLLASSAQALGFSALQGGECGDGEQLERPLNTYSAREWTRHFGVLDRSGLSLPLYARLLAQGQVAELPRTVVDEFERRRNDNARRMQGMLARFGESVGALQRAGVQFICVKGFSLIPEFLPELWQRHQIDFDFLIRPGEEERAQRALEEIGYKLTAVDGPERRLRIPVNKALGHNAYLYGAQEGSAIELHSSFWDAGAIDLPLRGLENAFDHAEMHALGTIWFPRLTPPYAFLYQVLHVFRHFLGSWARPMWVYEIAAYMNRFLAHEARWNCIRSLVSSDSTKSNAAALVLLTAREIFGCTTPAALEGICAAAADSAIGFWVSRYARAWLLTDMPGNKLNLLLHRHFMRDDCAWRRHLANRLAPRRMRPQLCEGLDPDVARSFRYRIADFRFRTARIAYHLRAGAGLALAGARWNLELRVNRTVLARAASRAGILKLLQRSVS
jgi:hypothetical protein